MKIAAWLAENNRIAHRADLVREGASRRSLENALRRGEIERVRRDWFSLPDCDADLALAAAFGGRLTCVTAAARLGVWVVDDGRKHLAVRANWTRESTRGLAREGDAGIRLHWAAPIVHVGRPALLDPLENALALIAECQPLERAVVIFDSALRQRLISFERLVRLKTHSRRFRAVCAAANELADSGIETLPRVRLARHGIRMHQQVMLNGHRVDGVIGRRLVLQIDGDGFHSTRAQRDADARQDAELALMGYHVLRFTYTQVMFEWEYVESTILGAIAQGLDR